MTHSAHTFACQQSLNTAHGFRSRQTIQSLPVKSVTDTSTTENDLQEGHFRIMYEQQDGFPTHPQ